MAADLVTKNGACTAKPRESYVKIMVVGERKVGKTKFIKVFTERPGNNPLDDRSEVCATVYQCKYFVDGSDRVVQVYEVPSDPGDVARFCAVENCFMNAFVFVYAVDDPSSFEAVEKKWLPMIQDVEGFTRVGFLVGNKKDLRSDPQVIQRLSRDGKAPVTIEQGKALVENFPILHEYYDCQASDENDGPIHTAFHELVKHGIVDLGRRYQE